MQKIVIPKTTLFHHLQFRLLKLVFFLFILVNPCYSLSTEGGLVPGSPHCKGDYALDGDGEVKKTCEQSALMDLTQDHSLGLFY